jgi:AraC-like DNA-binding protein
VDANVLAKAAGLSPYHFLRTFVRITGVTPHQFVLRQRLRDAATRISLEPDRLVDIALDSGFHELSTFNHAFRAEFGTSPTAYRTAARQRR